MNETPTSLTGRKSTTPDMTAETIYDIAAHERQATPRDTPPTEVLSPIDPTVEETWQDLLGEETLEEDPHATPSSTIIMHMESRLDTRAPEELYAALSATERHVVRRFLAEIAIAAGKYGAEHDERIPSEIIREINDRIATIGTQDATLDALLADLQKQIAAMEHSPHVPGMLGGVAGNTALRKMVCEAVLASGIMPSPDRAFSEQNIARILGTLDQLRIVFFDVNGLKCVNDLGAHEAGDKLLRTFGENLRIVAQEVADANATDILPFHNSGDEFIVAFRNADKSAVADFAQTLRARLARVDTRTILDTSSPDVIEKIHEKIALSSAERALLARGEVRLPMAAAWGDASIADLIIAAGRRVARDMEHNEDVRSDFLVKNPFPELVATIARRTTTLADSAMAQIKERIKQENVASDNPRIALAWRILTIGRGKE